MDFGQIESLLGLAATATGMTEKAVSTASAVKKLFAGDKAPDAGEVSTLANELAAQLTAANMMNVQISTALRLLSADLKRQDEFETERARYELFETAQRDIVFRLKEGSTDGQPRHFICPVCLNRDKLVSFIRGEGDYKYCQTNREHFFEFQDSPPMQMPEETGW